MWLWRKVSSKIDWMRYFSPFLASREYGRRVTSITLSKSLYFCSILIRKWCKRQINQKQEKFQLFSKFNFSMVNKIFGTLGRSGSMETKILAFREIIRANVLKFSEKLSICLILKRDSFRRLSNFILHPQRNFSRGNLREQISETFFFSLTLSVFLDFEQGWFYRQSC